MSTVTDALPADAPAVDAIETEDPSGRDRLVRNVLASWAGHFVFIVAGFIMPRQIDRYVGQVGLGVWDFGWTAVNYFFLAQIGVGVSVNRYVARYRAARDTDGLNRMIASVMLLQFAAAAIVMVLTVASAMWLPRFFGSELSGEGRVAVWVIGLLGTSVAVRMAMQAYSGIVTGCHRWDLHNLLNSVSYGVSVALMLVVLARGGGLVGISIVYLAGTIVGEIVRVGLAYRVCPELEVSFASARWTEARRLIAFGAKLSTPDTVRIVVNQLTNMLVLSQIGIGTLAVYSRLLALIRHTENIASKYSLPLTPTAGSLQGAGRDDDVRDLLISSTRVAAYMVWPILIGFAVVGDDVMQVWMGPRYDPSHVLMLMAVGSMLPICQQPIAMILIGLNMHGRYALFNIGATVAGFLASLIALHWLHWDLLGLAGVSLAVNNVVMLWVTAHACRRLQVPMFDFLVSAYTGPVGCILPLAAVLALAGYAFDGRPVATLVAAAVGGAAVLIPLYWRVLPREMRDNIVRALSAKIMAVRLALQPGS